MVYWKQEEFVLTHAEDFAVDFWNQTGRCWTGYQERLASGICSGM